MKIRNLAGSYVLLAGSSILPAIAQEATPPPVVGAEVEVTAPAATAAGSDDSSAAASLDTIPVSPSAEPAAAAPKATDQKYAGLEEIIVTAQKRAESLQNVPIAIQAFTGEDLEAKGITNAQQLQQSTPGLVYDQLGAFSIIYVRGVGTDAFIPSADLSIATYVDGVYFPFSVGLAKSFGAVERVEILKGPQGTLFGRNSTGGAISITTKEPSNVFSGNAQTSYGNYNSSQYHAYLSGPLGDTFTAAVGAVYNHKNDYYKLTASSTQPGIQPTQDKGLSGKLKWQPSDSFDATATGYYFDSRGAGTSLFVQLDPSPAGAALQLKPERDYYTSDNTISTTTSENLVFSLLANYRPGPVDLKSITASQRLRATEHSDFDGTYQDLVDFSGARLEDGSRCGCGPGLLADTFTQEFQILSNSETWGAEYFKWVAGLYFLDSTAGFDPVTVSLAGLGDISTLGPVLVPAPIPLLDLINSVTGELLPPAGASVRVKGLLDTRAYAGFLEGTYTPVDWLDFTAGLRYQTEKRKVYDARSSLVFTANGNETELNPTLLAFQDQRTKGDNLSPKAVVSLHPTDNSLVFLSYQRAFKSGSFNILAITQKPTYIRPEKVTATELGFKSEFFDHRVRVNGSIFRNDIKNLQSQFFSLLSGGVVSFQNAPKAHINGQELSVDWVIADGLLFNTSISHLRSVYDEFPNAKGYDETTGILTSTNNNSGNTIVRNPKYTFTSSLTYTIPLDNGVISFGADYYYNDGFFYDAQNLLKQNSYGLLGARISYLYEPWNIRLSAFANNITDEKRYAFQFQFDLGTLGKLDEPRTYFLQADWSF